MLQAQSLTNLPGVRHAFFTRAGGVSKGIYESLNSGVGSNDKPENVNENRARMAASLGVTADRFLTAYQIHSPTVMVAETPWSAADRPRADAIVTRTPGLAIGVSTADCGPVLMTDPEARVIGAAHAGWRGALTGVIEAAVAAMETLGAKRNRIVAAVGPMIRQPNYEVGQDLLDRFVAAEPDNVRFFAPAQRPGHRMFDLAGYVVSTLQHAGIERIEDIGHCTYADPAQFYSYRRATHRAEPDYGRHVNAIVLEQR
ncbi:MAG: peptidoglycan editing factor PgeF [Rhizobiales bacterium]|jgi:YfiH family protein|nr:peptidoglycan editing factor PgeF [Hyphomicrobiales bacterium]